MTGLPDRMTAIVVDTPGGPEVLQPKSVPTPKPTHGDILIRVAAAGLNRADLSQRSGTYGARSSTPKPPGVLGLEVSGVVAAMGEDANPNAVGGPDPESCDQFRPEQAPENLLVMLEQGVLTRISVADGSDLETDRGFGVGDSAADIKAAYGDEAQVSPHKYSEAPAEYITVWTDGPSDEPYREDADARGVVYEIGNDGNVSTIHVGGPSIQYVEGCS